MKKKTPFPLEEKPFLAAVQAQLDVYLQAMVTHWGEAPQPTLWAKRMVVLKVCREGDDKARSVIVRPNSGQLKKPRVTARRVIESLEWRGRWRPSGVVRQHMSQASLIPWEEHLAFAEAVREQVAKLAAGRDDLSDIVVWGEPVLNVGADFNLKGFPHAGKGCYVTLDNIDKTCRPARIAKSIAEELVDHRQTCDRCGEGLPSLQCRAGGFYYKKTDKLDVPPDPVERLVRPRTSMRLDRRLAAK